MDQASDPDKEQVDRRKGQKSLRDLVAEELRRDYVVTEKPKLDANEMIQQEKEVNDQIGIPNPKPSKKRWV